MSSTIDTRNTRQWFAVLRFCGAACGVLVIWMVVAGFAALAEPADTVTIFGPEAKLTRAVAGTDVQLINAGRGFMIVRGRSSGFVRALYAAGAWAVLPGGIGACAAVGLVTRNPTRIAGT
jgi:hypothetical protein